MVQVRPAPANPHHAPFATDLAVQEEYQDPDTLWQKAKGQDGTHRDWYQGAVSYWDQQEASYDGVLGGFGYVSDYDISDSSALLTRVSERVCVRGAGKGGLVGTTVSGCLQQR